MAARHQYRHDHHYIPDGVPDQNIQNRDTLALQVKLAELIVAMKGADNHMATIDDGSDEDLRAAREEVKARARKP
jgi:low affinity Fe/Cu permease